MTSSDNIEITRGLRTANRDDLHTKLLKYPTLVNKVNRFGSTLLHEVIKAENFDAMVLLLFMGANPNALTKEGKTPLYFAVEVNSIPMVDVLLFYNADYRLCKLMYRQTSATDHLLSPSIHRFYMS